MATSTDRPFFDRHFTWMVFAGAAALYGATLATGIQPGDGPELTVSAYRLGICHPSGYPTYTLLGRLFSLLPVGSVAFRMNLFSALCGAGAVALTAGWIRRITGSAAGALFAAAALATSLTLWREAASAEVYSFSALFLGLVLYLAPESRRDRRRLCLVSYLGGLALTNHLSLVFLLPPVLLWLLVVVRPPARILPLCALLFLVGLTPYLYLPIRASLDPVWNWGDPSNLDRLITHVSGMGYWSYLGEGNTTGRLLEWGGRFGRQLTWAAFLLVPAGALVMRKRRRDLLALVGGGALLSLGYTLHFQINDPEAYYIPVYILLAAPAAFAVASLPRRAALAVIVLFPAFQLWQNLPECNRRGRDVLGEYVDNLLLTVEKDAALIVEGDNDSFGLLYARQVDGRRKDITVWNAVLDLMPGGPLFDGPSLRRAGGRKREVLRSFLRGGGTVYAVAARDELGVAGYELVPWGLIQRYIPAGNAAPEEAARLWDRYATEQADRVTKKAGYLERILAATYPLQRSRFLLAHGDEEGAFRILREVEVMGAGLSPVLNNVGLSWWRAGRPDEARRLYARAAESGRDGLPRLNLAVLARDEGRYEEAAEHFRWVAANDARLRYDALLGLAQVLSADDRPEEAWRAYRDASAERPWEAGPHVGMAASRLAEGDFAAARSHYADAERLYPGMARTGEFAVARALRDRGELGEADEVSATLLADAPDDRDALELRAEIRAAQGRHEEADSLYALIIALDRNDPYGYNAFAWSLAERGRDLGRALDLALRSRRLAPRDPYIADTEGWILYKMGRFDEAVGRFREAIDLGFEGQGVNYRLAFALEGNGDRAEAEDLLREALKKDPGSGYAGRARRALGEEG